STQSGLLSVQIGKKTSLEQWIICEINSRNYIAGKKSHLLSFCEEIIRFPVECKSPDYLNGNVFFRNNLCRIQNIVRLLGCPFLIEYLDSKIPLGIIPFFYCFKQISSLEIRIGTGNLHRLIPD